MKVPEYFTHTEGPVTVKIMLPPRDAKMKIPVIIYSDP